MAIIKRTSSFMAIFFLAQVTWGVGNDLQLKLRSEVEMVKQYVNAKWDAKKTAVVICDMWDRHWCKGATSRVKEMAPRMNSVLKELRKKGVLVIHCPSSCMKFYENTSQRKLAKQAPVLNVKHLKKRRDELDIKVGRKFPIDDSDGGCDCFPQCSGGHPVRQIETIKVEEGDAIAVGFEPFYLMKQQGITNVIIMGVHTGKCILKRPFAIKFMVASGQNIVLMRDMTDGLYNHKMRPYVTHFQGTELVINHIEKYWCPTITSSQIIGGEEFKFKNNIFDKAKSKKKILFILGEDEYKTATTIPDYYEKFLTPIGYEGVFIDVNESNSRKSLLKTINSADLIFLSLRRRELSLREMMGLKAYLSEGKPIIGIRTASHGFDPKGKVRGACWPEFDKDVLGMDYQGHYGNKLISTLHLSEKNVKHSILKDIGSLPESDFHLYKNRNPSRTVKVLLVGTTEKNSEPVAWTNIYGKNNAKIFYTSLGKPHDFKQKFFQKMIINAIDWALIKQK